ncbi:spore cortex biosynthesis protein YabQ [Effusibacillus lacus]|uniref:spore cortex biosynthesis protein YabQ n=1 Tax=Effusibacillus lacus TaxID=1348429 RepID=UPI000BB893E8|nr:spore cortex biosynthesis protein YabQ [Effusibacillus lacus]TCS74472.1 spore cortex biosynthesis protein YabQ [Effusibacillus lacus]
MTLQTQYMTLMVMGLNGMLLGAVYDMYRVVLRHWKFLRWASPVFDLAFWVLAVFLVFWSLMWANNGELRLYVFVLMGIGLAVYRLLFRKIVIGSTVGIIMSIGFLCLSVYKGFLIFVVGPIQQLWRTLIIILRAFDRLLRVLEKVILWPFQPLGKILQWLGKQLFRWTKKLSNPLIRPFLPYLSPWWNRLMQKTAPVLDNFKSLAARGKGIWSRLTNWLFNGNEDNPKS